MSLTGFLLARVAEDETAARAALANNGADWTLRDLGHNGYGITGTEDLGNPRAYAGDDMLWDDEGALGMFPDTAAHVVRHDPARALAECQARRYIIAHYQFTTEPQSLFDRLAFPSARAAIEIVLRALALPYSDHPDYREEWKP